MGNMNKKLFVSIVIITLIISGCGSPQSGNTYIAPQQINEPQIAEITPTFEIQIERVNNCDGANPTYNVSYKTIETQKATFEVSVGAGGLVTGTPIPSVLEVQLEAKITAALAKDYGLTTEKNHDITLENLQGTFLEHKIEWKVTRVKGLVEVIYGDGVAQVIFDKIANVELFNRTSQSLDCNSNSNSVIQTPVSTDIVATLETQPPATQTTVAKDEFDGWVMCWHGRDGYEYLIGYPESDVKQGVNLNFNLTNAQGRNIEVANDSLKMCYVNGEWYGYPDPNEWFPSVSYLKLQDGEFLVCSDSPGCQGKQWKLRPEKYFPWNSPELQAPKESGIHIIAYKPS